MRDKKLTIVIIIVLMISVIGLGIAFAAFSQTLTINGIGTVESSSWSVVFEGADGSNTLGAPTLVGTATEVTHPTIKNNSTEISNYAVRLKSPRDSVTYNFKIHNKGDYAANLSSLTVAGVNRPNDYVYGLDLLKSHSVSSSNRGAVDSTRYSFYYTSDNVPVGQYNGKDCLEPGESVNVSLKIEYVGYDSYNTYVLPQSNVTLNNLGISATYTQSNNGSCPLEPGTVVDNEQFRNNEFTYYTYEGKSFVGTGVNNIIISENIIGLSPYSTEKAIDNGANANPRYTFVDTPAKDMAEAYCSGCRLMSREEALSWGCPDNSGNLEKCKGYYNGTATTWYLSGIHSGGYIDCVFSWSGNMGGGCGVKSDNIGVRPVVSIPEGATMTGSGTQQDPYVISTN